MKIEKHGFAIRVSREMAVGYGLVESTPEEAAERAESRRIWKLREVAAWQVFDAMVPRLEALTDPTVRAVLALHSTESHDRPECAECYTGDDHEVWPCSTVKVIAEANKIRVPDIDTWRRPE